MRKSIIIVLACVIISCAQQKVDTQAEGEKVMQLSKEWSEAASSGDVDKVLSYWADDAIMMTAAHPTYKGKDAIRKMVEESMTIPGFSIRWQPVSVEVSESGDMAYLIENSQVSYTDSTGNAVTQRNKTVSIWRKQADGSWKNVVDISTPGL
jgi:uncharacterized protein (TIGR02246 family)